MRALFLIGVGFLIGTLTYSKKALWAGLVIIALSIAFFAHSPIFALGGMVIVLVVFTPRNIKNAKKDWISLLAFLLSIASFVFLTLF